MKNHITMSKLLMMISILIFSLYSYADSDDSRVFKGWIESKNSGVSEVKFKQYDELCGRCHFSYQPGLLPGTSWEKMMRDSDHHFGQALNMTNVEKRTMRRYLLDNSAGHVNDDISNKILHSFIYRPIPIRITKTPFILNQHQLLNENKILSSIGQCDTCHQDAKQGKYQKDKIHFPEQSQINSNYMGNKCDMKPNGCRH